MKLLGILCAAPLRLLRHRPRRVLTALGPAWRCASCGTARAALLEFDGDDGYVDPARRPFAREPRYVRSAA